VSFDRKADLLSILQSPYGGIYPVTLLPLFNFDITDFYRLLHCLAFRDEHSVFMKKCSR